MSDTELIRKHKIIPFLNSGTSASPTWVQIKKATEYVRSLNPVSEDREYICDEMPTTELTGYKPSSSFTVTTYKGEDDFELLYDMYMGLATGEDAKKELLIVHVFDSSTVSSTTYYRAIKSDATILMNEWNISANTISCEVHENGTPTLGYVTLTDGVPSFTSGDMPTA